MKLVGVISDTHGLLRSQALAALRGSDLIVHAGDIGAPEVVEALRQIAPVFAVCGNVDKGPWTQEFPATQVVEVDGTHLYVLHDLNELNLDPVAAGLRVVISGHSHRPEQSTRQGVLYLNPGSAGPRRFHLPCTLAKLRIAPAGPTAEIVHLEL